MEGVGESVVGVCASLGGIGPHVVQKVDGLVVCEPDCVDGALVRWPVEAEPPSVVTIMVKVGVGA